jgi:Uma2 family endonuclease
MATETSEIAYEELRKFSVDEYHQMAEVINLARHAQLLDGVISEGGSLGEIVRRFTVDEYYKLAEAGILQSDERIELLNGLILKMAPIGSEHADIVDLLNETFLKKSKDRYRVGPGRPVRLGDESEPQPDIVLFDRRIRGRHPQVIDTFLLVEVSETTRSRDFGTKLNRYSADGISEYWIVDIAAKTVHVFRRDPAMGELQIIADVTGGTISPGAFPDVMISVEEIFK